MEKIRFLFRAMVSTLFFSAVLFLSAGRMNYFQGWIFLATNLLSAVMNFLFIRNDAELMNERSRVGQGAKSWDKLILGLSALTYLLILVTAGLDSGRHQWSPGFHWSIYLSGIILTLAGQWIFLSARKQNKFFSSVVRIQRERGHHVVDTGLYQLVRHPGYLGMMISLAGLPLLTGSLLSILPTAIAIVLLGIRTYLEDQTLKKELAGYREYAQRVRKRLVPLVW